MTLNSLGQDMHLMTGDMFPVSHRLPAFMTPALVDWYWALRGEAMTEALVESMAYTVKEWRRLYLNEPMPCPDQEVDRITRHRECHPTPPQESECHDPWCHAGCIIEAGCTHCDERRRG